MKIDEKNHNESYFFKKKRRKRTGSNSIFPICYQDNDYLIIIRASYCNQAKKVNSEF